MQTAFEVVLYGVRPLLHLVQYVSTGKVTQFHGNCGSEVQVPLVLTFDRNSAIKIEDSFCINCTYIGL